MTRGWWSRSLWRWWSCITWRWRRTRTNVWMEPSFSKYVKSWATNSINLSKDNCPKNQPEPPPSMGENIMITAPDKSSRNRSSMTLQCRIVSWSEYCLARTKTSQDSWNKNTIKYFLNLKLDGQQDWRGSQLPP